MPSLADHLQEFDYLPDGEFDCTIKFHEMKTANSGNRGPEFVLTSDDGRSVKTVRWLSEKALSMYAQFASHAGMTKDELGKIDFSNDSHHAKLDGRRIRVTVARDSREGKYAEVAKTAPVNPNVPAKGEAPQQNPQPSRQTAGNSGGFGNGGGSFNPGQGGNMGAPAPDDDLPF